MAWKIVWQDENDIQVFFSTELPDECRVRQRNLWEYVWTFNHLQRVHKAFGAALILRDDTLLRAGMARGRP